MLSHSSSILFIYQSFKVQSIIIIKDNILLRVIMQKNLLSSSQTFIYIHDKIRNRHNSKSINFILPSSKFLLLMEEKVIVRSF